jgi:hypothetical protein
MIDTIASKLAFMGCFKRFCEPHLVWHIFGFTSLKTIPMKRLTGWILAGMALLLVSYKSFENMDAVVSAIRTGNVNQLSAFFDSQVDISLPDKSDTYSKTQAEMVISDFFATNGVKSFKITQQGESGGVIFCTGVLQTHTGNFRTTLFFRQKGDKHFLQEIRFQSVE